MNLNREVSLAALAVVAGATTQGALGFGSSLVWMSVFPMLMTVQNAVGVLQPLAITLNCFMVFQLRSHIIFSEITPVLFSIMIGMPFGIWIVTAWKAEYIDVLLGVFLVCYVFANKHEFQSPQKRRLVVDDVTHNNGKHNDHATVESSLNSPASFDPHERPKPRWWVSLGVGFVTGCLTVAFGTGGPALLVFAKEAKWEAEEFRANLAMIFLLTNTVANTLLAWNKIITLQTLGTSSLMIIPLLLGLQLGRWVSKKIDKDLFRRLVFGALGLLGLLYVYRGATPIIKSMG
eukprot:m.60958 g.60958  ORF g.60958 m.60958 type:complete len:290 (-) comp22911_c0_seq1:110-979(-)